MTTAKKLIILLLIVVFGFSFKVTRVYADDPVCDPFPEDPEQMTACIQWAIEHPYFNEPEPGFDPANPQVLSFSGTYGLDAAYNSKDDKILVVGYGETSGDAGIFGQMLNGKTLEPIGSAFKIDQGPASLFAGAPKAIYNSDEDRFLIAWEDERPRSGRRSIYGRFVSGSGAPEGGDFAIIDTSNTFLLQLIYDEKNNHYAITGENEYALMLVLDSAGKVIKNVDLKTEGHPAYEGGATVAFNSNLNEYWVPYKKCLDYFEGGRRVRTDCETKVIRIGATDFQRKSDNILISGMSAGASIAYSQKDGGAMLVWEDLTPNTGKILGKTLTDDLALSEQFDVFSPGKDYSSGWGGPIIHYNPWTETFMVSAWDNDYGTGLAELDFSGLIYNVSQPLAMPQFTKAPNFFARLFGVKTALAAAYGNYNQTSIPTKYGATVFASQNLAKIAGSGYSSINAAGESTPVSPPPAPTAPTSIDTTKLSKMINQIYVWSLGIAGLLAVLMVVVGGYMKITSAGNAQQASKGTEMIWGALIGLAILFGSYLLLNTINPNLVNLQLNLDGLNGTTATPTTPTTPTTPSP